MENEINVSIVIVTYNSEDEIVGCLDSIFSSDSPAFVFVVDNKSSDKTKELLQNYALNEPRLKLILNNENLGLAAANNQPLELIKTKYTMILNPDILLQRDSISKMVDFLENHPHVGMVGPLCKFENGEPHVSSYSSYSIFTIIGWRIIPHRLMRIIFDRYSDFGKSKEVLFVSGACYVVPTSIFKLLKGYDPSYFLTISDVADIGVRLKALGYKAFYYPQSVITHFSGRSNAPLKYLTQYWGLTGDLYFIRKHFGTSKFLFVKYLFITSSFLRGAVFYVLSVIFRREAFTNKGKLYLDLVTGLSKYSPSITAASNP